MSYFKTSFATLQAIAHSGRYEDLAGFLVLARHASGLPHAGFEPYKLSGAGVNSIHEKAGVSEETARGVIERLKEQGIISAATPETRKAFFHARWKITQGTLDLDLPHALVDSLKDGTDSALRRLRKHRIASPGYAEKLTKISDSELRLDALMLLLAAYRHTSMTSFGGVSPYCIYRGWEVKSQTSKLGSIRWGAEPDQERAYLEFMAECLRQRPAKGKEFDPSDEQKTRFWNAWKTLKTTGLVYEAVALYDVLPSSSGSAQLQYTLRVNDYHAGSVMKTGDPSLLRTLEDESGSRFAFYTPAINDREEPEAMWVLLPDKRGALVGVWRPRFRSSNHDTGTWIANENAAIETVATTLEANAAFAGQA